MAATTPPTRATKLCAPTLVAAPVNCAEPPVALLPPAKVIVGLMVLIVTVSLPAAQGGMGTPERVIIMSAEADGQPGVMVKVEVAF